MRRLPGNDHQTNVYFITALRVECQTNQSDYLVLSENNMKSPKEVAFPTQKSVRIKTDALTDVDVDVGLSQEDTKQTYFRPRLRTARVFLRDSVKRPHTRVPNPLRLNLSMDMIWRKV